MTRVVDQSVRAHRGGSLARFHTSRGDGREGVAALGEKREPGLSGRASGLPET